MKAKLFITSFRAMQPINNPSHYCPAHFAFPCVKQLVTLGTEKQAIARFRKAIVEGCPVGGVEGVMIATVGLQ